MLKLGNGMTSKEVVDQLNIFREAEGIKNKRHYDFMKSIEVEFAEEINERNISVVKYVNKI